jgi:hypothetical protein
MFHRAARRLLFALGFAVWPAAAGCELAFDFDRTPLQPVYEGGVGIATDSGPDRAAPSDAGGGG